MVRFPQRKLLASESDLYNKLAFYHNICKVQDRLVLVYRSVLHHNRTVLCIAELRYRYIEFSASVFAIMGILKSKQIIYFLNIIFLLKINIKVS